MFEQFIGHRLEKAARVHPLTKDLREKLRRNTGRTVKINDSNEERARKKEQWRERERKGSRRT